MDHGVSYTTFLYIKKLKIKIELEALIHTAVLTYYSDIRLYLPCNYFLSESNTNNTYNLNFNNSKTPPSEFPTKNSTKYPILNDPNKLALLTEHTVLERAKIIDKTAKNISKLAETTPEVDPKTQVELIENGEDTEDVRERNRSRSDSHEPGVSLDQGQLAATLAGIFVLIAVIGYIGLLSWRRFLE